MTQISHHEIELAEVVQRSDLIIIARHNGRTGAGNEAADGFLVKEVLLLHLAVKAGDVIAAHPANEDFFVTQAEHLKKLGHPGAPSPIFPHYRSSSARDTDPIIVFLSALHQPSGRTDPAGTASVRYRYVVDGAYESVDRKQDIVNELKKRPSYSHEWAK